MRCKGQFRIPDSDSLAEWLSRQLQSLVCKGVASNPAAATRCITRGCTHGSVSDCNLIDSLAEWSKALAPGASPQGRGFKPHSCHVLGTWRP